MPTTLFPGNDMVVFPDVDRLTRTNHGGRNVMTPSPPHRPSRRRTLGGEERDFSGDVRGEGPPRRFSRHPLASTAPPHERS
jgi:hypothetical protein